MLSATHCTAPGPGPLDDLVPFLLYSLAGSGDAISLHTIQLIVIMWYIAVEHNPCPVKSALHPASFSICTTFPRFTGTKYQCYEGYLTLTSS